MKAIKKVLFGLVAAAALLLTGCPTPDKMMIEPSATIDETRMVFVEEDGSEIPLLTEDGEGPEEILDYVVLDDSDPSRSVSNNMRIRCVILGRHGGRPAIWVYYRYRGLTVLPNEDGLEEPELLELVEDEANPWTGDDWVYDALALSDDGMVIIGNLSRPDGWEFEDYLGEVPDPEIGIWWTLLEGEENLYVTRARPMILMEEPTEEESVARCAGGARYWWRLWRAYLIEWWQTHILTEAWNYMAEVEDFVDPADVEGGIPEGYYVASGTDKNGEAAWAWFTKWSMNDITEAPDEPVGNTAPYAAVDADPNWYYYDYDENVDGMLLSAQGSVWDGEGDAVTFVLDDVVFGPTFVDKDSYRQLFLDNFELTSDGVIKVGEVPLTYDEADYEITLVVRTFDGELYSDQGSVVLTFKTPPGVS